MKAIDRIKAQLKPGCLYRRKDLCAWSNAVDRHLAILQKEDVLEKLSAGLYYCPRYGRFGKVSARKYLMISAFLRDDRFLFMNRSLYNELGVGTTQLYNETIVYNHKRHGMIKIGGFTYKFVRKQHFPLRLTKEFVYVDLIENLDTLPDNRERVVELLRQKAERLKQQPLLDAIREYGGVRARKFFGELFNMDFEHYERTVPA